SSGEADQHRSHPVPKDELSDRPIIGCQGNPQANLLPPLLDAVGYHAINPDRAQQHRAESTSPTTPITRSHLRGTFPRETLSPTGSGPGHKARAADSLTTATASLSSSRKKRPSRNGIPIAAGYAEFRRAHSAPEVSSAAEGVSDHALR